MIHRTAFISVCLGTAATDTSGVVNPNEDSNCFLAAGACCRYPKGVGLTRNDRRVPHLGEYVDFFAQL